MALVTLTVVPVTEQPVDAPALNVTAPVPLPPVAVAVPVVPYVTLAGPVTVSVAWLACTVAVLEFLSAWTRQLNAEGYLSGVYSSRDSGILDMQSALAQGQGFTRPQAVWYAQWDGQGNLSAGNLSWPQDRRAKQFLGPHNSSIGGYTLNIDSDIVAGPVAR